jgi:hypothetical protein
MYLISPLALSIKFTVELSVMPYKLTCILYLKTLYMNNKAISIHSKSTIFDVIPARFVKDAATVLTKPITYIVNLSIASIFTHQ